MHSVLVRKDDVSVSGLLVTRQCPPREIRRTRVVGAFLDGQSALNLAAARLRQIRHIATISFPQRLVIRREEYASISPYWLEQLL
jgi:hypothetical protein